MKKTRTKKKMETDKPVDLGKVMENRCNECKHFKFIQKPILGFKERLDVVKAKHPTLSEKEAEILADCKELFEQSNSDFGKCGNRNLPELRDVEFNGKTFGCIYYKK